MRLHNLSMNDEKKKRFAIWLKIGTAVICAGFLFSILVGKGAASDSLPHFTAHLDRQIPKLMKQYAVPGVAIALVQDGKPVWSNAYGYADLEQNQPMTIDSIFRVESISKSLTAWGVMKLVEQGKIDLDQPIQIYLKDWTLPSSEFSTEKITPRRLLGNNAGMPLGAIGDEYSPRSPMPALRDVLFQEAVPIQEPGLSFSYSNAGFHLLELLIEQVSGRDFAEYMQDEVLLPLGMVNSTFVWDDKISPLLPTGYDLTGRPVPSYVYPAKASGGLYATVEDIARFISAGIANPYQQENPVLSAESIREIYTPQIEISGIYGVVADDYGLGHFIENLPDGRRAVWHGGQGHGWMTHFHMVPESGDGIVILTNSQRSWPLMAKVLKAWADWNSLGSVKMERITYATTAFQTLIAITFLVSCLKTVRLIRGVSRGKSKFAPFSRESLIARLLQAFLGIDILAGLAWSTAQPYLMITSIFPGSVRWAGFSLLILAIVLIFSALFTPRSTKENLR